MGTIESVGTHLARLLPKAHADTLRRLEGGVDWPDSSPAAPGRRPGPLTGWSLLDTRPIL